jgi:hypothetical protein
MARRPNYGAEKRSKELSKQRKKDEKAEKKRLRKEEDDAGGVVTHDGEMEADPSRPAGSGDGEGGVDE